MSFKWTALVVTVAAFSGAAVSVSTAQQQSARGIMEQVTVPESTAIFDVIDAPADAAGWRDIRQHADRIAASGPGLLASAPTGGGDDWATEVRAHMTAAREVQDATDARNVERFLEASDHLASTCVNCHAKFLKKK